jgi:hypothetical protein
MVDLMGADEDKVKAMMFGGAMFGRNVNKDLDAAMKDWARRQNQAGAPDQVTTGFGPKETAATRAWDSAAQGQAFDHMVRAEAEKEQAEARKVYEKSAARNAEQAEKDRIANYEQGEKKRREDAKALAERNRAIESITVAAPQASSRLAAIGGFVGGRMGAENAARMREERALKAAEASADYLAKIKDNTES